MRQALLGLVPEFKQALNHSSLSLLYFGLTSLDLGHHDGSVLKGLDGIVVVHVFSLSKPADVFVID